MLSRLAALTLAATLGLASWPGLGVAQPIVRVRAETRIELRVERTPDGATLHATLRDDRGDPLPDRPLGLRVFSVDTHRAVARAAERTDPEGRVQASFELPLSEYRVEADYRGDERYRTVRVEQRLDLARAHVRLGMALDADGRLDRLDLERPDHRLRVTADSDVGGGGLEVVLSNELREELARGVTDDEGVARFTITSDALGPPAAGRLVVRTPGDAQRAAAQTEVLVVRYLPTELSLTASPETVPADQRVRVEGVLRTARGPLGRKAVGLYADGRHLATLLTDDEGRYLRELDLDDASDEVTLEARFESDAPWRPDARSEAVVVRVESGGATPWQWLLISMAVCVVLLLALSRRGRREAPLDAATEADAPATPGIAVASASARAATLRRVAGSVLDAQERRPLRAAVATLRGGGERFEARADADGRFDLGEVPDGSWALHVTAPGYQGHEIGVTVPHRGEWGDVTVTLLSLRQLALKRFQPLAEALRPTRRWWAFWTARELASRAGSGVRQEVTALTDRVEEAAYAGTPPSAEDVDAIGDGAARLADRIDPSG